MYINMTYSPLYLMYNNSKRGILEVVPFVRDVYECLLLGKIILKIPKVEQQVVN